VRDALKDLKKKGRVKKPPQHGVWTIEGYANSIVPQEFRFYDDQWAAIEGKITERMVRHRKREG